MDAELDMFETHELDAAVREEAEGGSYTGKIADHLRKRQKLLATLRIKWQHLKDIEEQGGGRKVGFTDDYEDGLPIHANVQPEAVPTEEDYDDWPCADPRTMPKAAPPKSAPLPIDEDDLPVVRAKPIVRTATSSL